MEHITFWPTADDINIKGRNIYTIKQNIETLLDTSKEIAAEVNEEKMKYMFMSH
jgi:hypothetical protein